MSDYYKSLAILQIFLIKSKKDLGLQVPPKPFGMKELAQLMGGTCDVNVLPGRDSTLEYV